MPQFQRSSNSNNSIKIKPKLRGWSASIPLLKIVVGLSHNQRNIKFEHNK